MKPFNSYAACDEGSDSDSSYCDDMSKLTLETGGDDDYSYDTFTVMSKQTGFKSTRFARSVINGSDSAATGAKTIMKKKKNHGLNSKGFRLPYFLDAWRNGEPRNALGVQIWWLSGNDSVSKPVIRVSTEAKALVLNLKMPSTATIPETAFGSYLSNSTNLAFIEKLIGFYPSCITWKHTVAKLCGRNMTLPEIWLEMRIELPFTIDYALGTKKMDPIFFGARWVSYDTDNTKWLHIELVAKKNRFVSG